MFKFQRTDITVYTLAIIILSAPIIGYAQKNSTESHRIKYSTPSSSNASTVSEPKSKKFSTLVRRLKKQGYDITPLLQDPRFKLYDGISDRFRQSAEKKSPDFKSYKKILGFEKKREQIAGFMRTHQDQLEKAEKTFGIPKYVISAIIGIESDFGQNTGNYNPFNAYVSMYAENYRKEFAFNQIKHLLIFVRKHNLDVFDLKSSYAGAMTFGQFIPYSLNKWFIGDDITDMNDNIMSVANYLSYFKKRTGSVKKAVLRYNPSHLYTKAVLELAHDAKKQVKAS